MVLIQFQWHLASALGRAPICVHANRRPLPAAPCTWATLKGPARPAYMLRNQRGCSSFPRPAPLPRHQVSASVAAIVRTLRPTGRPSPGAGLGQGREALL